MQDRHSLWRTLLTLCSALPAFDFKRSKVVSGRASRLLLFQTTRENVGRSLEAPNNGEIQLVPDRTFCLLS